jgi:hypothetical protein
MRTTEAIFMFSVGLASVALALGYGLVGMWLASPLFLLLGALWIIGWRRAWGIASLLLAFFLVAVGVGVLIGVWPGWMLLSVILSLCAWDLEGFRRVIKGGWRAEAVPEMERRHLRRLGLVSSAGLLLAVIALLVRVRFAFGIALLVGLLAAWGLGQVVRGARRGF